jgi:Spy/CpxP family protein refolding chaperone
MKSSLLYCLITVLCIAAHAAPGESSGQPTQAQDRIEQRTQHLKQRLSLTDGQMETVRSILHETHQQVQNDRQQYKNDRRGMLQALKSRTATMDQKIEALLTGEQKNKYQILKQERREYMRKRIQEQKNKQPAPPY